jgi:c-di-GMP phosphodiesterase
MARDLVAGGGGPTRHTTRQWHEPHPLARSLQLFERRGHLGDTLERVDADVQTGLGEHEFFLVYQPRVSLRTLDTVGVEALLRWDDSSRGLIGPRAFLPSVKQTKAMITLGRWVLEEACLHAAAWERARPVDAHPLMMSVNVTALEVLSPTFTDTVLGILGRTDLPIDRLQIEIDAGDQLGGDSTLVARLQSLRHQGLRVAIDNVGPTFAIGNTLIAADSIHIHRRWVRSLSADRELTRALSSLVERAHRSGAQVCATGVESERERQELAVIGCDQAQGFLFCPPIEGDELDWIADAS